MVDYLDYLPVLAEMLDDPDDAAAHQDAVAVLWAHDEIGRLRTSLRLIRDGCRCTCGEVGNTYCPHCDAVAGLDEDAKENDDV